MNLQQTGDFANKISEVQWVKWTHPNSEPANTSAEKQLNVLAANVNPSHCAVCLNMNGCCFAENNCPKAPLHQNCHCKTEQIDGITVTTECPIEKFTRYIFNDFYVKKGKKYMFEEWGFTIMDSAKLKNEMEQQAYNSYLSGEYQLNKLDGYGQRIDIVISLNCKNGKQVSFKTGWMTYPDGKLVLITPYGGKI